MIYLDNGATTLHKAPGVYEAVNWGLRHCGNPGRGGYPVAMEASNVVFRCRERAGRLFHCSPEQVVFTTNCTHGLNIAIRTLLKPGDKVVISGFEHNAVTRPLHHLGCEILVAGNCLFSWTNTLEAFEQALKQKPKAAVFTHVSNVFGYVLPIKEMAGLCKKYGVPFIIDAAQSAGSQPLNLEELGAAFIAMPGHKGLLGPMGTGLLLCTQLPEPLLQGGTGSQSYDQQMPEFLPDRAEAGTLNLPGICGLSAALKYMEGQNLDKIMERETQQVGSTAMGLGDLGVTVFFGPHQGGTISFLPPKGDCETVTEKLASRGICLRAGLHCAPLAHESAGTLNTGTIRVSFGPDASPRQTKALLEACRGVFREVR